MNPSSEIIPDDLLNRAQKVRLIVMDVDGVLSDGVIALDNDGKEHKNFHVRDGSAIAGWLRSGRQAAILSGRKARCVEHRARELGIPIVLQGNPQKIAGLQEILKLSRTSPNETCFIGDDLPDLPLFGSVGLAACPADAVDEVRGSAHFVSRRPGGHGAVHEVVELIMKTQGLWQKHIDWYSQRDAVSK